MSHLKGTVDSSVCAVQLFVTGASSSAGLVPLCWTLGSNDVSGRMESRSLGSGSNGSGTEMDALFGTIHHWCIRWITQNGGP